jgi:hypothetical protein
VDTEQVRAIDFEVLERARIFLECAEALITPPRTWSRHEYARAAGGRVVEPTDPSARRWSAAGALMRAREMYGGSDVARAWDAYDRALAELARGIDFPRAPYAVCAVNEYNSRARSKRAVIRLFKHAIYSLDAQLAQA